MVNPAGEETVLYNFTGGAAGIGPATKVILDPDGNLYGTTGFAGPASYGEVYKIDTSGRETVLYGFTGGKDGGEPYFGVTRNAAGDLFGTTDYGGFTGYGVVYKLDSAGKETVLHTFRGGTDGAFPNAAGVLLDAAGNLYGTTEHGGPGTCGVVYKLDAAGDETILYSFTCGTDGAYPLGGLIRDADGNLYGTTMGGGEYGLGVVFKIVGAVAN